MALLYKILPQHLWDRADQESRVPLTPQDVTDGYIHLSSVNQIVDTAHRYFGDEVHLVLVTIDEGRLLDETLRWEPSHGGDLFPHVYGDIPLGAVVSVHELVGDHPGRFDFPDLR